MFVTHPPHHPHDHHQQQQQQRHHQGITSSKSQHQPQDDDQNAPLEKVFDRRLIEALQRPPPVPDEIQFDSLSPVSVSAASDSALSKSSRTSPGSQKLRARLDSFAVRPHEYENHDYGEKNGGEELDNIPTDNHSNHSMTSTIGGDSFSGLGHHNHDRSHSHHNQPRLTRPAPQTYQLQERNLKSPSVSGVVTASSSRSPRHRKPRSEAFAIERERWDEHGYPGAYAMPGTGIFITEDDQEAPDRTNVSEREDDSLKRRRRTILYTLMIVLAVVVVSAIVVVAVVVAKNNQTSNNVDRQDGNSTSAVENENTDKDDAGHVRFSKLAPFLRDLNTNSSVAWDDPHSPQSQALHWLIYEDSFTETAANVFGIPDFERIQTRYVLAVLYFATGGGGGGGTWQTAFNFTSPFLHECDWSSLVGSANAGPIIEQQGVVCNDRFEVTAIILENNGLRGSLPEELGSILTLEVLRLTHNELTGRVPPFKKLQVLDLSVNRFHGRLMTIRRYESWRPTLLHLNVSHNMFNGSVLQEMIRGYESTLESPYAVHWIELQVLDLSNCLFTGAIVGEVLAPMSNLETFRINDNDFTGSLPSAVSLLTTLSEFSASGNQLDGTFPWSHLARAPLTRVEMSNNQFTGDFLPTSIALIASSLSSTLEYLDFSTNNFGASNARAIPESIGQLSQLQNLLLANNGITGTLPSTLGDLAFLRKLDVSQNSLMGTLPSELANCELLEELVLNDNSISGTIPQGYAQIPHLVHAMFHSNTLSGDVGFLCTARDGNSSAAKNNTSRSGTARVVITADCLGESPEVECAAPCCDCQG